VKDILKNVGNQTVDCSHCMENHSMEKTKIHTMAVNGCCSILQNTLFCVQQMKETKYIAVPTFASRITVVQNNKLH